MKMSDKEISDNINEIRLEKALATELEKTSQIIKRTGIFDPVDNIYGEAGAEYSEGGEGEEGGEGGGDGAEAPEGGEGGEGGGEEVMEGDPGFDDGAGAAMDTVADDELSPEALQKFFSLYGIEFPKGSSISYFNNRITMNNTAANHRLMVDLLARINVNDPLIEVEVKSIELSENDMEELGFNWALSGIGESGTSKQWMFGKGENTNPGGSLSMLNGLLSGIDSRLISNLNIFPDVFGSWKPFGSDVNFNLSLTINALDRSDRTEQISAPRVLVRNGVTAVVKMTKAYFFPEEWEELEVETEEVGDNGDLRLDITYPSPTFSESESNIGTQFTVTPTILDRNVIRLQLNPKVTAYTGKDEYEVVLIVEERNGDTWNKEEMRFIVWRPIIATREVSVTVDVNHGETLVIGGLSDSQSQKRLDKIPILADLPLIGRLFQNQSEISIRRNMLIFVTARLVDNSGISLPVESKVGNGGIPALKR
jgi:type II secretory pathway component GspD/PulD (secretin)